jgi:hypothetical protein
VLSFVSKVVIFSLQAFNYSASYSIEIELEESADFSS